MSWSFIEHISGYLARPRLGDQKSPTQWPSEATTLMTNDYGEEVYIGKCQRAAFFRLLVDNYNFSEKYRMFADLVLTIEEKALPPDPYLLWLWKCGELYEEYCVQLAKESGVFVSAQTPVFIPEYNVSGKLDIVVIDPETGKFRIVEVKSVYGFGANVVLGSPAERAKGLLGTPRESNLMQIGLYQWWYANKRDDFAEGLLTYGARDTGRFAEYAITVEEENTKNFIFYQGIAPNTTRKVNSGISIENILSNYEYVSKCVDSGEIPPRSFTHRFDEETLQKLFDRGELNKTDAEQFSKRKQQLADGKARVVKQVERGNWQCRLCGYFDLCYDKDENPTEL